MTVPYNSLRAVRLYIGVRSVINPRCEVLSCRGLAHVYWPFAKGKSLPTAAAFFATPL